jgi:hypothetical protein
MGILPLILVMLIFHELYFLLKFFIVKYLHYLPLPLLTVTIFHVHFVLRHSSCQILIIRLDHVVIVRFRFLFWVIKNVLIVFHIFFKLSFLLWI